MLTTLKFFWPIQQGDAAAESVTKEIKFFAPPVAAATAASAICEIKAPVASQGFNLAEKT